MCFGMMVSVKLCEGCGCCGLTIGLEYFRLENFTNKISLQLATDFKYF